MADFVDKPLRQPSPVEDRKATALEKQADQAEKLVEAQSRLATAYERVAGLGADVYHRPTFFKDALMAVVSGGNAASTADALESAESLTNGFEARFPNYVSATG